MNQDAKHPTNGDVISDQQGIEPHLYRLLTVLLLVTLSMGFLALSVLYLDRSDDRRNLGFEAPSILWLSTFIIIASSGTCFLAVRSIRSGHVAGLVRFLGATMGLAVLFIACQAVAWFGIYEQIREGLDLVSAGKYRTLQGLFVITTVVHALHLLGGLIWLQFVFRRSMGGRYTSLDHQPVGLFTMYWHFLDVVWIGLFIMIMFF